MATSGRDKKYPGQGPLHFQPQSSQSRGHGIVKNWCARLFRRKQLFADAAFGGNDLHSLQSCITPNHPQSRARHFDAVGRHLALNDGFAQPERGFDEDGAGIAARRIGCEHHAGGIGGNKFLDDDRHLRAAGRDPLSYPI